MVCLSGGQVSGTLLRNFAISQTKFCFLAEKRVERGMVICSQTYSSWFPPRMEKKVTSGTILHWECRVRYMRQTDWPVRSLLHGTSESICMVLEYSAAHQVVGSSEQRGRGGKSRGSRRGYTSIRLARRRCDKTIHIACARCGRVHPGSCLDGTKPLPWSSCVDAQRNGAPSCGVFFPTHVEKAVNSRSPHRSAVERST